MSLGVMAACAGAARFPRPRGDEPDHSTNIRDDLEFSPPTRG